VRIVAPERSALATSTDALRRLLAAAGATAVSLDGAHLPGLAATLPLGTAPADLADLPCGLPVRVGHGGVVLGVDRHEEPVTVRLFRREPTRAVLVGGLACAQLISFRALAAGARVIVQTGRPQAWEPFVRGASDSGDTLVLVAANRALDPGPATALRPQLLVKDATTPAGGVPGPDSPWRTSLHVFDEPGPGDLVELSRAELVLLQTLPPPAATAVGAALGLGETAQWLTRIRADMLGVVAHRRTLRWLLLSPTPIERQLIGRM
jgi:hypothetical protein